MINEGTIFPVRNQKLRRGYAYHVPYRSILPKPEQCDNLLVPVALSCTHVGISSLRIEGAWMVIGQGAGVAGCGNRHSDHERRHGRVCDPGRSVTAANPAKIVNSLRQRSPNDATTDSASAAGSFPRHR